MAKGVSQKEQQASAAANASAKAFNQKYNVAKAQNSKPSNRQSAKMRVAGTPAAGSTGAGKGRTNIHGRTEEEERKYQEQRQAQQQEAPQEQTPETTFTDEASKGKGQTEQQEATRYTQEANADPAKTLAETAEGKQKGSAWAKQRANEASTELADLQADRLRVSQLYENGEPPSEQTLQALGLKTLEEYDYEIGKAEEQADYYERLANEADGSKGFLEGLKERHDQQMENMSKQSDNWWEDPEAAWAFGSERDQQADDLASGWAKQFASGPVQAVGTGLQWFDQSSDDMVRYEYDQEHGEGAYDRAIAGKNVNQVGQLGDKLWDVGTNLYESGQEDWERGTENMSDTGKTIANIAKTGMDVVGDAALNAFAPGLGTMRMYLGAAGGGAYEQSQRENNDIDSRAVGMVKNGLNAYLSNKLLGGLETVYGQSVLGGLTDDVLKNASPQVQKTLKVLLNTEGLEEGLEDILNWGGDIILGLNTGTPLDWDEVKQDAFIGYVLGVVTNGLAGGMNIDSKKQQNIAQEGVEFAEGIASGEISGIDEAAEIGKRNTSNNVTMKPGADAEVEAEAEAAAPEAEATAPETAVPEAGTPVVEPQQTQAVQPQQSGAEPASPATTAQPAQPQSSAPSVQGPAASQSEYTGPRLPNASYGGGASVKVGNTRVPTHYAVVPVSDLVASHDVYGNINNNYPSELQPRDRSRETSQAQVRNIGTNIDPGELEWSNNATSGAPIIRSDGVVVSGNGRTLGLTYAFQNGRGQEYTNYLRENAARFGIDPNSITDNSVLVRVVDGDYDWQAMAETANVSTVSRMNVSEQARIDAERLSRYPDILSKLVPNEDGDLNTKDNEEFVKEFLQAVVPLEEQGDVWTKDGGFSKSGMERVKYAIFQAAYGDASLMQRIGESLDNNMKNVSNAMLAAAPKIASLEAGVADGTRYIGVRDGLLEGVKIFEEAKSRGVDVAKVVEQLSVDNNANAMSVFIAEFLQDNTRSAKQLRTFMNALADTAESFGDPTQVGFFSTGDEEYSFKDVLEGAIKAYETETGKSLGRPDYDFYGEDGSVFDLRPDQQGQSGDSAQSQPAAGSTPASTGENTGSRAEGVNESPAGTLANTAEGQGGVNTPGNAENAVEGGLNRSETNEGDNPLVTAAEGRENTGNQTGNPAPETREVPTNPEGVAGPNIPNNPTPPRRSRERISQFFTNTLTESGRATGMNPDDFAYKVKSEAESLTNAIMALDERGLETFENLMNAPAWDGEMVDSAWMIENEFYKEFVKTGDRSRLDNWKQIEAAKIRETARGLQAVAKQSRPGAAGVLNAIMNEVNSARQSNADAERAGRTNDIIPEETLARAEEKANEVARRMAELEIEVDESVKAGTSEADAQESVKERYLDLIDEINTFRHTGLFQDMGKHAGARADAKAQKQVQKLNTKFRRMLSNEGMDYIMRFAACDAAGISEDIHYKGKQDVMKRLNTWQKLAQLTGTGTWLRNGVGNGSFGIVDVLSADNPVTILTDALISLKTGKRSSGFETGIVNRSARDAAAHALNRSILEVAANIDLSTDSDTTKYDMGRTRTYDPDSENLLTRIGSRWEQWNGYMLQSSDAWFKGMAEGSVESSVRRANRWGEDNLTDTERSSMDPEKAAALTKKRQAELDEVKKQVADYRTFQNDGITAKAATEVRDWFNQKGGEIRKIFGKNGWQNGQFGLGTALMPYVKVPTNLAVKSLEFSPAGAAKGVAEIVKVMTDPNATMAQQNKAVTDFGRGLTGTAIIWGLTELMRNAKWFRDWNDEEDKDVKAQNRAEGKSGIQLNLDMMHRQASGDKSGEWRNGDRVIDISSMEPFNQLITTAGLIAQQENPTLKDVGQAFWTSSRDSVMGMPALQAIANIEDSIRYTETPEDGLATAVNTAATTLGNVAGGMVPGPVRHIAQVTDDKQRDTSGNNPIERTVNTVKSSIPGLRETLPVKTDAYGNEQSAGDFATRFANQYDAFKHNQVNQSEVSREVERIRQETGESHVPARNGPKSVTFGSGSGKEQVKLTAEERKDYRDANGQDFSRSMEELMKDPVYLLADDDTKELLMAEAEGYANDGAKLNLAEKHDIDFESKYTDYREMEDPVEVLAAQTAYSAAKKDEDWDAVDALLKTIQKGDGRISEEGMDFMIGKDSKINYYTYLADHGVATKRAKAFEEDLKELYTSEKRNDSRSTDMIRVAGNGKYTEKEADAIMGYEREVSDESRQRYQDQLAWNLEKAGKSGMYNEVWARIEAVETGDMESAAFKKWVDKNIPLEQRKAVKDIASNLAEDRHAAGKYVSSFYGAAREIGCTPEQALQFFEHIDTNYNGSYTKKEIRAAIKWAFGSGQNAKDVTAYLKERGIL